MSGQLLARRSLSLGNKRSLLVENDPGMLGVVFPLPRRPHCVYKVQGNSGGVSFQSMNELVLLYGNESFQLIN